MTMAHHSVALIALIALLPAVICWWSGRRLARHLDDPLLPERLLAHRRRNGIAFFIALVGQVYLWPAAAVWTTPLQFVAVLAAAFPLRRVLYEERWSLGTYLVFHGRVLFGLFAFWIVLGTTPVIAAKAGDYAWLAGAALACGLLVWNARHADILRRCLGTTPLEEGPFLTRCRALTAACRAPAPRFERINLHGGVIANALALPSLTTSSVLFTDTLLTRLTEDEATAICAHELAHLEYYDTRRLRQLNVITQALIALSVVVAPAARLASQSALITNLFWFGILVAALVFRAKDKQKQETVCDTRAVELTGDTEPLVQALTKLYALARIPRRIESQQERTDTHPSLARRIRDIRRAGGRAPAPLADAATFTSVDGRTVVTFEDAVVHWAEPGGVTQTVAYTGLSELRLDASRATRPRLIAVLANAKRWEMPITPADIVRAQAVLDRVDGKLGEHRPQAKLPFAFGRAFVGFLVMLTMTMGQVAVAFVALLAWIRPAPRLLAAAGAAALTGAMLALRTDSFGSGSGVIVAMVVGVAGLTFLGLAFSKRQETAAETRVALVVLAIAAVLPMPFIALNSTDAVRLHQSAQNTPSAAILLVALASALAWSRTRRAKVTALAMLTLATCTVAASSPAFLDRFGSDPFLVEAPAFEWRTLNSTVPEEFDVPFTTSRIWLSRDGRYVAALQQQQTRDEVTPRIRVGRVGETLATFAGNDLVFVDDNHFLLVESDAEGTTLREMTLNSSHDVVWRHHVRDLQAGWLDFEPESRRWTLIGWDDEAVVRAAGVVGDAEVDRKQWRAGQGASFAMIDAIASEGPRPVVVETTYDRDGLGRLLFNQYSVWALMLLPFEQQSRYWMLGEHGRTALGESRLPADCHAGALPDGAIVCGAFDGTRTRFVRIDGASGLVSGIGYVDGRFVTEDSPARGWLTGWAQATPVAIDLTAKRVLRLPSHHVTGHLTVSGQRVAAVTYEGGTCKVRTWMID
jgi:Zn-dependent protease with chaperone function